MPKLWPATRGTRPDRDKPDHGTIFEGENNVKNRSVSRVLRQGLLALATIAACAQIGVEAQQPTQAQANAIRQNCRSDYMRHCSDVPTGGAASLACLEEHAAQVSGACRQAL